MDSASYRFREGRGDRENMIQVYKLEEDGSYTSLGDTWDTRHQPDSKYEGGGSGLFSNTRDYAKFTQMLANGGVYNGVRILGRNTIDLMRTNMLNDTQLSEFTYTYSEGYGYGLGVRTMINNGGVSNSTPGEFGWTGMAGTWTSIDPANRFSVVYMQNTSPNNEEYHHMRIRAAAYGLLE